MNKTLANIKWKSFSLNSLFFLEKGKCSNANRLDEGNIPYIGATNRNNGVMKFSKSNKKIESTGNCIVFIGAGDGSAGYSIYKKENIICSTSNICGYNNNINKYIGLFITTCLDMNSTKYSHGYSRNMTRIKKDYIMLPINSKGEPNYEFMEEYIKEKEKKLKQQYKIFIQERIEKYKTKVKINKKYKPFLISDIFETVQRGKRLIKNKQIKGKIPYVSSTATNNGIDNFISNNKNIRKFKNCLSLANSGSVGTCFYEPFEFIASDHVTHLKGNFTKYTYLFLANMLNRLSEKYNFNREINDPRIQKEYILLPISKNEPDYEYMHNYMLYLEQKKILEYLNFIK